MKNIFTEPAEEKVNDPHFTGPVVQRVIVSKESDEQIMYYVVFKEGARTFVHSHPSDQILIGCEGEGIIVLLDIEEEHKNKSKYKQRGEAMIIKKGDTIVVPKNTFHYHGSNNKDQIFGHIAIRRKSGETNWDENTSFPL